MGFKKKSLICQNPIFISLDVLKHPKPLPITSYSTSIDAIVPCLMFLISSDGIRFPSNLNSFFLYLILPPKTKNGAP